MDFGKALQAIKEGYKVARRGWNGNNMFVFLVPGSTFKVNRPPLLGIYPEGAEISYHAHIDQRMSDGRIAPWVPTQDDLLAEDWRVVKSPLAGFVEAKILEELRPKAGEIRFAGP